MAARSEDDAVMSVEGIEAFSVRSMDSLLTLAGRLGYGTEEGRISVEQWRDDTASGAMTEAFACGTAAIITPIGPVRSAGASWTMGGEPGPVSMRLRRALLDIQHGETADADGWMHRIC